MTETISTNRNRTLMMCMCAMFTALITAGGFIKIPVPPVPFTLQFQFTTLAGLLLGKKYGSVSVILYVLLGLAGIPVFTKGGGLWYVLEPTFGYLLGYIPGAYVTGLIAHKAKEPTLKRLLAASFAGYAVVYAFGMTYCYIVMNFFLEGNGIKLWPLIKSCFLIFAPKDITLTVLVSLAAKKILPATGKYLNR